MTALLEYFIKGDCSIREYWSKEFCAMHLSPFLQFEHFSDCSIKEYQSILDEWSHYSKTFTYYASIMPV